ncbi:MAG TPA: ABC transporter substrate-binding protein [Chloroflexota bacterium]|nr:ABC transporter substrate-binding protein [Chloroflexota bacterium]
MTLLPRHPAVFTVFAFLLAACGGSAPTPSERSAAVPASPAGSQAEPAAAPAPPPRLRVRMAMVPGALSHAARFVAVERGYFEEEGIEIEEHAFDTSAKMLPALAADQVDMAVGGISAGLFNAIAQGIAVRLVLDHTTAPPGEGAGGLLVRKDLIESGRVRDVSDLRGQRVAITSKGQATEFVLHTALTQAGLAMADVEVPELAYPDMTLALANRSIEAAIMIEPFAAVAVSQGVAVRFKRWGEIIPNDHMAMLMFSQRFAETNAEAGRRYAKAYVRGIRDYHEARTKGRDREAILAILMKYTGLRDRAVVDQMDWVPIHPDGRINGETLAAAQDFFAERGYVPNKVDLTQVIDHRFADYAVAQLGPYQP